MATAVVAYAVVLLFHALLVEELCDDAFRYKVHVLASDNTAKLEFEMEWRCGSHGGDAGFAIGGSRECFAILHTLIVFRLALFAAWATRAERRAELASMLTGAHTRLQRVSQWVLCQWQGLKRKVLDGWREDRASAGENNTDCSDWLKSNLPRSPRNANAASCIQPPHHDTVNSSCHTCNSHCLMRHI